LPGVEGIGGAVVGIIAPDTNIGAYSIYHQPVVIGEQRSRRRFVLAKLVVVALSHLVPPYIFAAPRLDAEEFVPTVYDPEEFATLEHADKDRAIALVAAMFEPQRVREALAYAAWLDYHDLEIDVETVLAAWEGG
jgi:hypothetical protein